MDVPIYRLDRHSLPAPHSFSIGPQVSLEITRGRVQQRMRLVKSRVFLIGAASDCDLVLGDLQFPEAYAYLFVNGSELTIRRLGAGPPLVVCGEAVESVELFHGDRVAFGPFEFRVQIDEPPKALRPRPPAWMLDFDDDEPAGSRNSNYENSPPAVGDEVHQFLSDLRRALRDDDS